MDHVRRDEKHKKEMKAKRTTNPTPVKERQVRNQLYRSLRKCMQHFTDSNVRAWKEQNLNRVRYFKVTL